MKLISAGETAANTNNASVEAGED
ncbi:transcriptional regulator, partial [Mesorhizobium sp. M8A.F.Ca.ET.023.02.2.1]